MKKLFKKAFTLVELVVVIAVVAILSAVAVGSYFGVTESAKMSNSQVAYSEAKQLMEMYLIENNSNVKQETKNDFQNNFTEYLEKNGYNTKDYELKAVPVNFNETSESSVSSLSLESINPLSMKNGENEYNGGLLFIISDYYSYFPFSFTNGILETNNEVYKTGEELSTALTNDAYLSSNLDSSSQNVVDNLVQSLSSSSSVTDAIRSYESKGTVKDTGNSAKPTSDVIIKVNINVYYEFESNVNGSFGGKIESKISNIQPLYIGESINDSNPELNQGAYIDGSNTDNKQYSYQLIQNGKNEFSYKNNSKKYSYEDHLSTEYFDLNYPITLEFMKDYINADSKKDENLNAKKLEDGTYLLSASLELYQKSNVIENAPILVESTKNSNDVYYFTSFEKFNQYQSLFKDDNWVLYVNGDLSISSNIVIPENIDVVIDYETQNLSSYIATYNEWKKSDHINNPYNKGTQVSNSGSCFSKGVNDYTYSSSSKSGLNEVTVTIKSGASLTINSILRVEGDVYIPHYDTAGSPFELGNYACINIEKGGNLNLNASSELWAIGKIAGDGDINTSAGTKVYELFKYNDWRGITFAKNYTGNQDISSINAVFPFSDYYIDNIEANLNICYGCSYNLISTLSSTNYKVSMAIPLISSSACEDYTKLGTIFDMCSDCIIRKSAENGVSTIEVVKGTLNDKKFEIDLLGFANLNLTYFNFPLANLNIIIQSGATVNLGSGRDTSDNKDLGNKYLLLPSSNIEVKESGKLNITENYEDISTELNLIPTLTYIDSNGVDNLLNCGKCFTLTSDKNESDDIKRETAYWEALKKKKGGNIIKDSNGSITGDIYKIMSGDSLTTFMNTLYSKNSDTGALMKEFFSKQYIFTYPLGAGITMNGSTFYLIPLETSSN